MKSEEVIEIIEAICDKLGIAMNSAKDIIPELAKREIAINLFWVVTSIIIILISVKVIRFVITRAKKDIAEENPKRWSKKELTDYDSVTIVSSVGVIMIMIFIFALIFSAKDLVAWIASPQASAIAYVLDSLNQQ